MSIITCYPNPILNTKCFIVDEINSSKFKDCKKALTETWKALGENALGLSANQVGFDLRMFLMIQDGEDAPTLVVNPEIIDHNQEFDEEREYCFSLPGLSRIVPRMNRILVKYTDENGEEVRGWMQGREARIFQHELDHLDGSDIRSRSGDLNTGLSKLKKLSRKYKGVMHV